MDRLIEKNTNVVNVFTFGFGKDHDANMLRPIAERGQGSYYYIEKQDEIPTSFADCIGGLLSVVAQNLKLTSKGNGSVKILESLTQYPKKTSQDGLEISLGDLYSGEQKDLLILIEIPKLEAESQCD